MLFLGSHWENYPLEKKCQLSAYRIVIWNTQDVRVNYVLPSLQIKYTTWVQSIYSNASPERLTGRCCSNIHCVRCREPEEPAALLEDEGLPAPTPWPAPGILIHLSEGPRLLTRCSFINSRQWATVVTYAHAYQKINTLTLLQRIENLDKRQERKEIRSLGTQRNEFAENKLQFIL